MSAMTAPATSGKARFVLTLLLAAALPVPFGFDKDAAERLWGSALAPFDLDALTVAVEEWIGTNDTFPTLSAFLDSAQRVSRERARAARPAWDARECPECGGDRYVSVVDSEETIMPRRGGEPFALVQRHRAPCSTCPEMATRHGLYLRGHFDAEHEGCAECSPYRHRSPPASTTKGAELDEAFAEGLAVARAALAKVNRAPNPAGATVGEGGPGDAEP